MSTKPPATSALSGAKFQAVHYKGATPALTDVMAGHIQMMFISVGSAVPQWKADRVKFLAVGAGKRMALLPDVPTVAESGLPGYEVSTWYALWAVKGTPKEVVDRMYRETAKVLEQKDIRDIWTAAASEPGGMPPEQFGTFIHSEIERWAKVVKDAGVKLEL